MISALLGSTADPGRDQTSGMNPTDDDHRCAWRERAEALQAEVDGLRARVAEVDDLKARLAALERFIHGRKSESMPPKDRELNKGQSSKRNGPEAQEKRRNNDAKRDELPEEPVQHPVPPEACTCPNWRRSSSSRWFASAFATSALFFRTCALYSSA